MKHLKVIARARWEVPDCFNTEYKTIFTLSVLKPSQEYPIACVSMSVVKGNYRIFDRYLSIDDVRKLFVVPEDCLDRMYLAYNEAQKQAESIREHQRAYDKIAKLKPGSMIVDTGTGEIIAEAERILKESE